MTRAHNPTMKLTTPPVNYLTTALALSKKNILNWQCAIDWLDHIPYLSVSELFVVFKYVQDSLLLTRFCLCSVMSLEELVTREQMNHLVWYLLKDGVCHLFLNSKENNNNDNMRGRWVNETFRDMIWDKILEYHVQGLQNYMLQSECWFYKRA